MSEPDQARVVVTKPMQYLIARQVVEQLGIASSNLAVVPHFSLNDNFIRFVRRDPLWDSVEFFPNKFPAIVGHGERTLITNSDIGKDAYLNKLGGYNNVCVYEEGWGTYLDDILVTESWKKKLIYSAAGFNRIYGNSMFTDYLLTYRPRRTKHARNLIFDRSLPRYLAASQVREFALCYPHSDEIRTIVLLGKKDDFNASLIERFRNTNGVFFKLHPHMTRGRGAARDDGIRYLPNDFLIEFFLLNADPEGKKLTVVHDNSSIQMYFKDFEHITFRNVGPFIPEIRKVIG